MNTTFIFSRFLQYILEILRTIGNLHVLTFNDKRIAYWYDTETLNFKKKKIYFQSTINAEWCIVLLLSNSV